MYGDEDSLIKDFARDTRAGNVSWEKRDGKYFLLFGDDIFFEDGPPPTLRMMIEGEAVDFSKDFPARDSLDLQKAIHDQLEKTPL